MKKIIYLDNAASTPVDKKVALEIAKATNLYGNPSSYNDCGREAREYMEQSRIKIARFLGAHSDEIVFTASGTEANNLAILGIVNKFKISKPHIITTQIEHPSVLKPIERLKKEGFDISYLSADKDGFVDLNELKNSLRPETVLVSVMYANNEIGTIQPIRKISEILKNVKIKNSKLKIHETTPLFHVDACQATEYMNMNVNHLGVDLLTFNGSKIYGPKGIGVLYAKRGIKLVPILWGGEQEHGLRAGTENVPAIGGLAVALEQISKKEAERLTQLRDYFLENILAFIPALKINGPVDNSHKRLAMSFVHRLPNNVNISVPDMESEVVLLELDKYGICAGSGSACSSHLVEPSHVLKAIGLDKRYISGALRFSMGRQTTKNDIDYVLKIMPKIVKDLKNRYKKS